MDDYQKWLEAASELAQDIAYLGDTLPKKDLEQLQIALAMYQNNAVNGVRWPNPDDLYCIQARVQGSELQVSTEMRHDFRLAC